MRKDFKKEMEFQRLCSELAEKRTIELLGLTPKEVVTAKAFETTKIVEMDTIEKEFSKKKEENLTLWSVLWKGLS